MEKYFTPNISAYRKGFSTDHVHIRLLEEWRKKIDNNLFVGAILMDLWKDFNRIPQDLIIVKMTAYYCTNRKQCYLHRN